MGGVLMPRGDGTGPAGMGPLTGRGAGFCAGFRTPGYLNLFSGRGFGLGRRRGIRQVPWAVGLIPGCAYFAYRWANRRK
jgi:hypothetical protein